MTGPKDHTDGWRSIHELLKDYLNHTPLFTDDRRRLVLLAGHILDSHRDNWPHHIPAAELEDLDL